MQQMSQQLQQQQARPLAQPQLQQQPQQQQLLNGGGWSACSYQVSFWGPHCPSTTQRLAWLLSVISIAALQQAVLACICLPILLALTETGEPVGVG